MKTIEKESLCKGKFDFTFGWPVLLVNLNKISKATESKQQIYLVGWIQTGKTKGYP